MNSKTNKYVKKPGGSNSTQDCGGNRFVLKKQTNKQTKKTGKSYKQPHNQNGLSGGDK